MSHRYYFFKDNILIGKEDEKYLIDCRFQKTKYADFIYKAEINRNIGFWLSRDIVHIPKEKVPQDTIKMLELELILDN